MENIEKKCDELLKKEPKCTLDYVIAELLTTEASYIENMGQVVNGYMAELMNGNSEITVPEDLRGSNAYFIFANITNIYEWHRDYLLNALVEHQNSLEDLGKIFVENQVKFHMYSMYCSNLKLARYLVKHHNEYFDKVHQKLDHRLELNDFLLKPVHRLNEYQELFNRIVQYLTKEKLTEGLQNIEEAVQVMKIACINAEEFVSEHSKYFKSKFE